MMKQVLSILFSFLLMPFTGIAQQENFTVPIQVSDLENSITLGLGVHVDGSDGIDTSLDSLAPPSPPSSVFDAALRHESERFFKDVRGVQYKEMEYTLTYRAEQSQGPITLSWNQADIEGRGSFVLHKTSWSGENVLEVDMSEQSSLDLSTTFLNPNEGELKILLKLKKPGSPPQIMKPIPDTTLSTKANAVQYDLEQFFSDPEGGELKFALQSPASGILETAIESGHILHVTPLSNGGGTREVTIIATDEVLHTTEITFRVTLNAPPQLTAPLPDVTLKANSNSESIRFRDYFSDPDDGATVLTYTAESSDTAVVSTNIGVGFLELFPHQEGEGVIDVEVTDGVSVTSDSFKVTVEQPISVKKPIADTNLSVDAAPYKLNLNTVFAHKDNVDLNFLSYTSDADVATEFVDDDTLIVESVAPGEAEITVTARGSDNSYRELSFTVNIAEELSVVQPPVDTTLVAKEGLLTYKLGQIFFDPGGYELTFEAQSSAPDIVSVELTGQEVLQIGISGQGRNADITITATNEIGQKVETSFTITLNRSPELVQAINDTTLVPGNSLSIKLTEVFSDPDNEPETLSYYAETSDTMVAKSEISFRDLIVATREEGRADITVGMTDGISSVEDKFVVEVEHPVEVIKPLPDTTLMLQSDPYKVALTEFFEHKKGNALSFTVGSSDAAIAPALLNEDTLVVEPRLEGQVSVTVAAAFGSAQKEAAFTVDIVDQTKPTIPKADVQFIHNTSSTNSVDIYVADQDTPSVRNLAQRQGSLFKEITTGEEVAIYISREGEDRPEAAAAHVRLDSGQVYQVILYGTENVNIAVADERLKSFNEPGKVKVSVMNGVPDIAEEVEIQLRREDGTRIEGLSRNLGYGSISSYTTLDHQQFNFSLENDPQIFTFDLSQENLGIATFLAYPDEERGYAVQYINASGESFAPTEVRSVENEEEFSQTPESFSLSQNYPNPFNPTTTISYTIPKATEVSLQVYNIMGKKVGDLVDQKQSSGSYSVQFDAERLSSGMYFYRLQAGGFVEVNKMTLLK